MTVLNCASSAEYISHSFHLQNIFPTLFICRIYFPFSFFKEYISHSLSSAEYISHSLSSAEYISHSLSCAEYISILFHVQNIFPILFICRIYFPFSFICRTYFPLSCMCTIYFSLLWVQNSIEDSNKTGCFIVSDLLYISTFLISDWHTNM